METRRLFEGIDKMDAKHTILAALMVVLFLAASPPSQALNTREIERVRNKGVLDSRDLEAIDDFVGQAVQELVRTTDFTSIADTRAAILANSASATASAAAQYSEQFSESAYKHISEAIKSAEALTPADRQLKVMTNLLILIDVLESPRLAGLAMGMLNDRRTVIRYWAVHAVSNQAVTRQLNSGGSANLTLAKQIAENLEELLAVESSFEIIALVAEFAGRINIPQGRKLLLQIADSRIAKYADWTVDYELLDATILKLLSAKISSTSMNKAELAQRFAQLYSYAIQRYVKGRNLNLLSSTQKRHLVSVLVETEQSCVSHLLGVPQSVIRKALDRDDTAALLTEHNRALGELGRQGRLAQILKFDYGVTADGTKRTWPLVLRGPPEISTSK